MATIDQLEIDVSARVGGATRSLNALARALENVATKTNIDTTGLNGLVTAMQTLGSVNLNGVSKTINALTRLSASGVNNVDFTNFNHGLSGLVNALSGINGVDKSINQLIYALARLSTSGANIDKVAMNLPKLGVALFNFTNAMSRAGAVAPETVQLTQAIAQLANAGANTEQTAMHLDKLKDAMMRFINELSKAPTVRKNIVELVKAISQLASSGRKVGVSLNSASRGLKLFGNHASKTAHQTKGFAHMVGTLYARFWLLIRVFQQIKKAIGYASDLAEVQNVVSNTFGAYADSIEQFAKQDAMANYGMSELTAKKVASRFQAMGTAIGYSQKQMSEMSVRLTQLTGDMSSFYNVSQEDVAKSLESIFTGSTRPLRQYGIDLSQATLKEYALSKGMQVNFQTMTQAEKAMLRYQYVLERTGLVTDDFVLTADTWANRVRLLGEQLRAWGGKIGTIFINTFKPLLRVLNTVMNAVIAFTESITNALGALFGWTVEVNGGAIAEDIEDAEVSADGLADGLGNAAGNAKKLKQQLQGFDELNVLTSDKGSGGSGGSGGIGGGGLSSTALAELKRTESVFDKYKSEIKSLEELGTYISESLTKAMNNINWDSVYESARNFGKGLADFLNGLITPELFGALGTTIAGTLNTVLYSALSFGETLDWKKIGNSLSSGINNFFATYDFSALAKTVNTWALGIINMLATAVGNTNWEKIADSLNTLIKEIKWSDFASDLSGLAQSIVTSLSKALKRVDWYAVGEAIGDALKNLDIPDILHKLGELAWNIVSALASAFSGFAKENPLGGAIVGLIASSKLIGLGSALAAALGANWAGIGTISTGALSLAVKKLVIAYATLSIIGSFNSIGDVLDPLNSEIIVDQTLDIVAYATVHIGEITNRASFEEQLQSFKTTLEELLTRYLGEDKYEFVKSNIFDAIIEKIENFIDFFKKLFSFFANFKENIKKLFTQDLPESFDNVKDFLSGFGFKFEPKGINKGIDLIKKKLKQAEKENGETLESMSSDFQHFGETVEGALGNTSNALNVGGAFSTYERNASNMTNSVITLFSGMASEVQKNLNLISPSVNDALDKVKSAINSTSFESVGKQLAQSIKDGLDKAKDGIDFSGTGKAIGNKVVSGVNGADVSASNFVGKGSLLAGISDALANGTITNKLHTMGNSIASRIVEGIKINKITITLTASPSWRGSAKPGTTDVQNSMFDSKNISANVDLEELMYATNKQSDLLRQQNELLTEILNKDISISSDAIYQSVRTSNSYNTRLTGRNAFAY